MTPTPAPVRTLQPQRVALRLSIEDEARALRFHLQHGARWLLRDFQAGVGKLEQLNAPGSSQLPKLQHLVESTAQAAGLVLQTAQNAAAVVASSDAPFRKLHSRLLPLASYIRATGGRDSSRLFTQVFYWMTRRALETGPAPDLLVRQRLVDKAYWSVRARDPAMIARMDGSPPERDAADREQNLALCVSLLEALLEARPIYNGNLPPWAQHDLQQTDRATAFAALLRVVVALGLGAQRNAARPDTDASNRLQLATEVVQARLPAFEIASRDADFHGAMAAELAFVFRHA